MSINLDEPTARRLRRLVDGYWNGWHGDAEAPDLCRRIFGVVSPAALSNAVAVMLVQIRLCGRDALRMQCGHPGQHGAPHGRISIPESDAVLSGDRSLLASCDACFSGVMGDSEALAVADGFVRGTCLEDAVLTVAEVLKRVKDLGRNALRRQCCCNPQPFVEK
jgi:hypothetical protein